MNRLLSTLSLHKFHRIFVPTMSGLLQKSSKTMALSPGDPNSFSRPGTLITLITFYDILYNFRNDVHFF